MTPGETEKYATYMHDGRTDLAYADQRYYATGAGRFMTADPAEEGLNWYGYVGGDPVNKTDPTGLFECSFMGQPTESLVQIYCRSNDGQFSRSFTGTNVGSAGLDPGFFMNIAQTQFGPVLDVEASVANAGAALELFRGGLPVGPASSEGRYPGARL